MANRTHAVGRTRIVAVFQLPTRVPLGRIPIPHEPASGTAYPVLDVKRETNDPMDREYRTQRSSRTGFPYWISSDLADNPQRGDTDCGYLSPSPPIWFDCVNTDNPFLGNGGNVVVSCGSQSSTRIRIDTDTRLYRPTHTAVGCIIVVIVLYTPYPTVRHVHGSFGGNGGGVLRTFSHHSRHSHPRVRSSITTTSTTTITRRTTTTTTTASSATPTTSTTKSLTDTLEQLGEQQVWHGWVTELSPTQQTQLTNLLSRVHSAHATTTTTTTSDTSATITNVEEPTREQLRRVALVTAVPFVGFGIMDNAVMILAGDAIDTSLGVLLGISTMCAAAIGNIVSDVAGIMLGTVIEDFCTNQLGLHAPPLTTAQRQLRSVRFANQFGCAVGIVIGCIIGMLPLLFIDSQKVQVRKRQAVMDGIFQDVVTEAGSLVGAQTTVLFLLVDPPPTVDHSSNNWRHSSHVLTSSTIPTPTPDGTFLYAKYARRGEDHASLAGAATTTHKSVSALPPERVLIPLGRGIVSRAALTAEAWNIADVHAEPDFGTEVAAVVTDQPETIRNMVVVPVLDGAGRAIAVLQAVNKIHKGRAAAVSNDITPLASGHRRDDAPAPPVIAQEAAASAVPKSFTASDVQILKALASHISVALQRNSADDVELRLKDTIRMLKDYGLAGLDKTPSTGTGTRSRFLFPET